MAMNKNVFLWALYDFANTPLTVAMGGLFLAQWIVLDNGLPDIWYGAVFTASTILLLITSPFWGAWSDRLGKRMPFLKWSTYAFILLGSLMGIIITSQMERDARVYVVLILFFFLQYIYQISLVFYNSLMQSLSTPKTIGRISGIGEVFGEIGWLLAPAILLPFSMGIITLFGEPGRGQVFIPAAFILVVAGLPMILRLKEPASKINRKSSNLKVIYVQTIQGLKLLIDKDKNVTTFLLSFMFISDALLTANLYFAIYLDQIFGISDFQKFLTLAVMEIVGIVSSYIVGKMSDQRGTKKLFIFGCINLTVIYALVPFVTSISLFYVIAGLIGFGYGAFYTTARVLLIKISPPSKLGEYFGFYSTFQKFASIIGPLTWGGVTLLLNNYGSFKYRVAVFSLSILMLIGLILAAKVREKRIITQ
jgi:UMF1 family MFS transporter